MNKRLRIKGHKLITSWGGAKSTYARGTCECGCWTYTGWTERMGTVRIYHQNHLIILKNRAEAAGEAA